MLSKNIDRILSERDMRLAEVMVKVQSPDGIRDLYGGLQKQLGTVAKTAGNAQKEEKLDREGLAALKGMGSF
jgi:hypothetical protein